MKSLIQKDPDGTITLTITIPWEMVQKTTEEVIGETAKQAQVAGFRKGKAPKKLVEEQVDKEKIKEEVLRKLLPSTYVEAVKEHALRPLINPKLHVEKLADNEPWQFTAETCEVPQIELNKYKENIQKITAKGKIIIPGKEPVAPKFEDIAQALLDSVTITIPHILVEEEVERLLAQFLDEIKKLGLTLDQYLSSTNRTVEQLREEYKKRAENDIKLEFSLQKIAEVEQITVEQKEVEEAIIKAKDETERKNLESNKYLLASILRQQKTLDFLKNL